MPPMHVVRGGRDRGQLASPGRGRPRAARRRRSGTAPGRRARMSSVDVGRARLAHLRLDRARHLVARRELVDEALAVGRRAACAPSPRIASVTRKPSRPGTPVTAVGWNCTNSRSASAAPAPRREQQADARASPGGFVVRDHSAAAPPVARITARARTARPSSQHDADAAAVRASTARRRGPARGRRCGRLSTTSGGELAHDAPARSRCRRRARRGGASGRPRGRARGCRGGRRRSATPRRSRSRDACAAPRGRARAAAAARTSAAPGVLGVLRGAGRASRRAASAAASPPWAQ